MKANKAMVYVELGLDALGEYIKGQDVDWHGIWQATISVGTAAKKKYARVDRLIVGVEANPCDAPSKTKVLLLKRDENGVTRATPLPFEPAIEPA